MSRILCLAAAILVLIAPAALACDLTVTATADPMEAVCHGLLPTLTAEASGGDGNYTYQWLRAGSPIEGATASTYAVAEAGYYYVQVTDGNGCSVYSDSLVLYAENPSAEITVMEPVCIDGFGFAQVPDAGTNAMYEWSIANGTITHGGTGSWIYFTATASPVTIDATVTLPSGCSASGSKTVDAGVLPEVSITASGPTTFCAGGSVTLTANATNADSIEWTNGSTENSITVTTTGNYGVAAVNANGCSATAYQYVDVTDTQATVSGGGSICPGGSSNITAYLTGIAPFEVTWSDGVVQTTNTSWVGRSVSPAATTTYTVTAIDDGSSCSGTSQGSAIVVVRDVTANVWGGGTMCPSEYVTIHADLTGTPPFNVQWSDGLTQTVNAFQVSRNVAPSSTTTYSIASLSDRFCSGTPAGSATATVVAPPTATLSGPANSCPGGSVTISVALTGTAPWTIQWHDGTTQSNIMTSPATRTFTPTATTTYYLLAITDANCSGAPNSGVTVTPRPAPSAVVSGSATICAGSSATINATLTGTAPFSVTWSDGVVTSTGTRTVSPSATTTYTVTSVSDAYCTGSGSGSAVITVDPPPAITTQPQSQSIKKNTAATLSVAVSSARPVTYQWYRGASGNTSTPVGTNSATYTTPRLTATTQYWVRVTSDCGVTNSATATITMK